MHTESLTTHDTGPQLQVLPNADWFTEGGVTPDGKWWIAPTLLFIQQIWHGCVGNDLKRRGFRLGQDGKRFGASQHTVIYLPENGDL